jgi:hypothetical protein
MREVAVAVVHCLELVAVDCDAWVCNRLTCRESAMNFARTFRIAARRSPSGNRQSPCDREPGARSATHLDIATRLTFQAPAGLGDVKFRRQPAGVLGDRRREPASMEVERLPNASITSTALSSLDQSFRHAGKRWELSVPSMNASHPYPRSGNRVAFHRARSWAPAEGRLRQVRSGRAADLKPLEPLRFVAKRGSEPAHGLWHARVDHPQKPCAIYR